MLKKSRSTFVVVLCMLMLLCTSIAPSFAVGTVVDTEPAPTAVVVVPSPLPDPVDYLIVQGTVQVSLIQTKHLTLLTKDKVLYNLMGSTDGLEKYVDKEVIVKGIIRKDVISVGEPGILLEVVDFKPVLVPTIEPLPTKIPVPTIMPKPSVVPKPTIKPSPKIVNVKGIVKLSLIQTRHLTLVAGKTLYNLTGKTAGLEKYVNQQVTVTGYVQKGVISAGQPGILFYVLSVKRGAEPVPTSTPVPVVVPVPTTLEGTVKINFIEGKHIELIAKEGLYVLTGKSDGIEQYEGQTVTVKGYVRPDAVTIWQRGTVFEVLGYAPVIKPSPSPIEQFDVLQGTLKVTKEVSPVSSSLQYTYKFQLDTKNGPYLLIGKTEGLEKYDGQQVEVKGRYVMTFVATYPPMFSVESYKLLVEPTPTAAETVLQGYLSVTKIIPAANERLMNPYTFMLKTEKGPYSLQGNTAGLENYDGQMIEVTGTESMLKIYPPIFNIVSFRPLTEPTPTPVVSKVHTIISEKALYLSEPSIGTLDDISGFSTISWAENTDKAFFNAKITTVKDMLKVTYEFELAAVKASDDYSIKGLFNIKKNGVLVAKEIPGQLYGLTQPVGSYFKFYSEDTSWHMSAYITSRWDF